MSKLERLAPPGTRINAWVKFLAVTLVGSVLYTLVFFVRDLEHAIDMLYEYSNPLHLKLVDEAVMPPFLSMMDGALDPYTIFAFSMMGFVISNYACFHQESKSIYTMRRIRSPWELHWRSWTLPVIGAVFYFAAMGLMTLACYIIYVLCVPEGLFPRWAG